MASEESRSFSSMSLTAKVILAWPIDVVMFGGEIREDDISLEQNLKS